MTRQRVEPRLLTVTQAASYMGVSVATFCEKRKAGKLPVEPVKRFSSIRYDKRALDAWLDTQAGLSSDSAEAEEWNRLISD